MGKLKMTQIATHLSVAVNVLEDVVKRNAKLEPTLKDATKKLPPKVAGYLRSVCGGTLRHLELYGQLLDAHDGRATVQDETMRLMGATILYQVEHMERSRSIGALCKGALLCCEQLRLPIERAVKLEDAVYAALDFSHRKRTSTLTPAGAIGLPEWLHGQLQSDGAPLDSFGPLCLRPPDFLTLAVAPPDGPIQPAFESRDEYIDALHEQGFDHAEKCAFAPLGVQLFARPHHSRVTGLPGIREGRAHVQDATQQYGVSLLAPLGEHERLLDVCAAPGGKSRTFLYHQPQCAGVLALDSSRARGESMVAAAGRLADLHGGDARYGARASVVCADATQPPDKWWDGTPFGAVAVDAPCSGSGLLRTLPEVRFHRNEEGIARLATLQLQLLRCAWPLLKPGGELLYTTCSILSSENEEIVGEFLRGAPDAQPAALQPPAGADASSPFAAADVDPAGMSMMRSRRSVGQHAVGPRVLAEARPHGGIVFYPSEAHQGGFVALIRKRAAGTRP